MLERLGVEARRVMAMAEREAGDLAGSAVGCPHLLIALVSAGATGMTLDVESLRAAVADESVAASSARPPFRSSRSFGRPGRLPYTTPLLETLRAAWRRSVVDRGTTVTPAHLGAALVDQRPSDVVRLLAGMGVALENLVVERPAVRRRTIPRPFAGAAAPAEWEPDDDAETDEPVIDDGVSRRRHPSMAANRLRPVPNATAGRAGAAAGATAARAVRFDLHRAQAFEMLCPRCDDDLDPVIVDLTVEGREMEALACPACRALITAWPA